jgi:hypothetical protein
MVTSGIAERLERALKEFAPREIRNDKRKFQKALKKQMESSPESRHGTSYPAVLGYFSGATSPSLAWTEAASHVLRVRTAWLAFDDGEPTEEEQARRAIEERLALPEPEVEAFWKTELRPIQDAFGDGADRLERVEVWLAVLGSVERLTPPRGALEGLSWAIRGGPPPVPPPPDREILDGIRAMVGRALRRPLEALGLRPDQLSDDEFEDYVALICHGIRRLADAHRRARVHEIFPHGIGDAESKEDDDG